MNATERVACEWFGFGTWTAPSWFVGMAAGKTTANASVLIDRAEKQYVRDLRLRYVLARGNRDTHPASDLIHLRKPDIIFAPSGANVTSSTFGADLAAVQCPGTADH